MSVVSQDYQYEAEQESIEASCYRAVIPSQSSSYQLGDRILIELPHSHQTMMNTQSSWLNLSMTVSGLTGTNIASNTTDIHMSSIGIYSAISEINLLSNSSGYIQQIRNHQQIMAFLTANNTDFSASFQNSVTNKMPLVSAGNARLNPPETISAASGIAQQNFSIPLLGLLSDSNKQLPIGAINDNLTLEIVLGSDIRNIFFSSVSSATTVLSGGSATFTAEFDADMITLSDRSYQQVMNASKDSRGIISWNGSQIHASNDIVSKSNLDSVNKSYISFEVGGVKPSQLLQVWHCGFGTSFGSGDQWSFGNYQSEDWRVRLGSHVYPPQYVRGTAEFSQSVRGSLGQNAVTQYNTVNDSSDTLNYRQLASTNTFVNTSCGGVCYNFEAFYDTSQGIEHKGKQMVIESSVQSSGVAAANDIRACTLKRFTCLYSISPNGEISVSF